MHYIVDGYNLLRAGRIQVPRHLDLEDQRGHLIRLLDGFSKRECCKVTVVFDGQSGHAAQRSTGHVAVVFSRSGMEADTIIQQKIRKASSPVQITVVTSDREIQRTACDHGASVCASNEFSQQLVSNPRPQRRGKVRSLADKHDDRHLTDKEVDYWKKLFEQEEPDEDQ